MYILFIMNMAIVGLIMLGVGVYFMLWGISLFLYSINCGDVSFCFEEKSGVILMTMGALIVSVGANYLLYSSQIKSKTR